MSPCVPLSLTPNILAQKIYWTDSSTDKIERADPDGSDRQTLIDSVPRPEYIALDVAASKMYWTDSIEYTIERANLDGSGVETLVSLVNTGRGGPSGIALDMAAGKVYWTNTGAERIERANLDGSAREDVVRSAGGDGIALDVVAAKIYWTNEDNSAHTIERANLDGSDRQTLIASLPSPVSIALDMAANRMYWTDSFADTIERANLDGSDRQTVIAGLPRPLHIAMDVPGGKMYWTNDVTNAIDRANLDGSGRQTLVTGLSIPRAIALDVAAGKMYWADVGEEKIERANLDGSGRETVLMLILTSKIDIALAAGKIYWTSVGGIERANLDGSALETLISGLGNPGGVALDLRVTYDTWSSSSLDIPPRGPIQDCVRVTESTISTDLCGDVGPRFRVPLFGVPGLEFWIGQVPCGPLNLVFFGTSYDGDPLPHGARVLGASVIGLAQGTTLGTQGVENPNCSLPGSVNATAYAGALPLGEGPANQMSRQLIPDPAEALVLGTPRSPRTVADRTYDVWSSSSLDSAPHPAFHDCVRFSQDQMSTDLCGDSGPVTEFSMGIPGLTLWVGQVPCGPRNLVFLGTSYDGEFLPNGANVVGASVIGLAQGTTLGMEGGGEPLVYAGPDDHGRQPL